jgi:hypothetical protein
MIRALLRLAVIVVLLVAALAFFMGYRLDGPDDGTVELERPVGTTGRMPEVDTTRARETGAAIGEKVAAGANSAQRALADGTLTTKIKSKMALDDTIEAARIDVDTTGGAVTLSGVVASEAQRQRALQLARETKGVTSVTDRLVVR